jgi:hypothetical protein
MVADADTRQARAYDDDIEVRLIGPRLGSGQLRSRSGDA